MYIDKTLTSSKTLQFSLKAGELKRQGRDIISMGLGEPEFDTPDHIKDAAKQALDDGFTRYGAAKGLGELCELLAGKFKIDNNINADSSQFLITPGAKNALYVACASVLRPGDEVINFTPCYVSNNPILKLAEPSAIIHNFPLTRNDFGIDRDKLKALINPKTKLIVINYPNNPTGKMLTKDEADLLRQIVSENDLYLLSDEIYEKIVFGDVAHISPASFQDIGNKVITVNGFSKAYSMTGWRIGYVHANEELLKTMFKIHQQLNTNTAMFIQKAAVKALKGPQDHIQSFIDNLKVRRDLYCSLIQHNTNVRGFIPQGGFFGFLDISKTDLSSDHFSTELLEQTGVAVIPGISFGEDFDGFCRVSLVNKTEIIDEGLKRIDNFVNMKAG